MRAFIENGKTPLVTMLFISVFLIVVSSTMSHAATVLVATGPGSGHLPLVSVKVDGPKGNDTISFMAYQKNFLGGVHVAVGDVNGDGVADVITGSSNGRASGPRMINFGSKPHKVAVSSRPASFCRAMAVRCGGKGRCGIATPVRRAS